MVQLDFIYLKGINYERKKNCKNDTFNIIDIFDYFIIFNNENAFYYK